MSVIRQWASEYGIDLGALFELERRLGIRARELQGYPEPPDAPLGSESRQQSLVLLEAAEKGITLWRNNVGALMDKRNIPVRYGQANVSKEMNEVIKSADLIGSEPLLIQPWHVGTTVARFLSVEMKHEGWVFNPNDAHECAQLAWLEFVVAQGGRAIFATGPGML